MSLVWQSVFFCLSVACPPGMSCANQDPFSFWCLPKKKTVLGLQKKKAPGRKGEPKGGTGVAACGRTIRGAPAVRSAAARSGPVRFSPARPLRLGSVDARLLSHVILSVSEESPGPDAAAPDLSLRTSPQAGVEWRPAAAGGGNRQGAISAAAPLAGRGDQARPGNGKRGKVEIRFLLRVRRE